MLIVCNVNSFTTVHLHLQRNGTDYLPLFVSEQVTCLISN